MDATYVKDGEYDEHPPPKSGGRIATTYEALKDGPKTGHDLYVHGNYMPEADKPMSEKDFQSHLRWMVRESRLHVEEILPRDHEEILPRDHEEVLSRDHVEAVIDRYEELGEDGFPGFREARDYWVRSSRERRKGPFPTKPIAAHALALNRRSAGSSEVDVPRLSGGWSQKRCAASLLHNAGFIIVDENDVPVPIPDKPFLIKIADRIRRCAFNYYIAVARERGQRSVSIRAGTLHDAMGLSKNWANVCQVLAGPKFQEIAGVGPPSRVGPEKSTTSEFTFLLEPREIEPGDRMRAVKNMILYGPPGTGKTYQTAYEAVRICLGEENTNALPDSRDELMTLYRRFVKQKQVEFVTFHQSFSYEDFVEGLRPTTESHAPEDQASVVSSSVGFSLKPHSGAFKSISERARLDTGTEMSNHRLDRSRPIYKVSLGRRHVDENQIRFGLEEGLIHLGWGGNIDWSDEQFDDWSAIYNEWRARKNPEATGNDPNIAQMFSFRAQMQMGDYVVVPDGLHRFRAVGRVTGDYFFDPEAVYYPHLRKVEWLWQDTQGAERSVFYSKNFTLAAVYQLNSELIDWDALETIVIGTDVSRPVAGARNFVLIIDEINRANISKVFGELITLLEADKRLGARNEVKVRLPYSGARFGVPANLHIIGTMNTADRSIALLDTALRRRFTFRELMPDPSMVPDSVDDIDLRKLFTELNERIEYLFDREHQIGHAYFMKCKTLADVENAMRHEVIPLLAEYFYDDWAKIAAVLEGRPINDGNRFDGCFLRGERLVPPGFEVDEEAATKLRWSVKETFDFSKLKQS